jgi:catechol 2,3-dioxygenase-like lactoylglutathione lyase family enzyme
MPLSHSRLISFVSTAQPARALSFYRDVLGLAMIEESALALVFDAPGTMLRVTIVERVAPAPYTVLGWAVGDIAQTVAALRARGVTFRRFAGLSQDHQGVWRAPSGAHVAWFADPDGNLLSLTEL